MSDAVEQLVAEIETLDLEGLRDFWRERFGAPPSLRSEPIMRQLLAWRVQAQALGGLDDDTRKALARSGPVQPEGKHLGTQQDELEADVRKVAAHNQAVAERVGR